MVKDGHVPALPGQPERFILRNSADIRRVRKHLLSHWRVPRVQVSIDSLPVVESQRAQHRFDTLSESCNCLLGEMAGGVTLLIGCYRAWVHTWLGPPDLMPAVIAAVVVGVAGKAIEKGLTRMRLVLVLRRLQLVLAGRIAGTATATSGGPGPAPGDALVYRLANRWPRKLDSGPPPASASAPPSPVRPRRQLLVGSAADVNRAAVGLFFHWKLPRIDIAEDTLAPDVAQRAQYQLRRLREGPGFMLAAVLATITLLAGFLIYLMRNSSQDAVLWTSPLGSAGPLAVLAGTLLAALAGVAAEAAWKRLRLLGLLLELRRQFRGQADGARQDDPSGRLP
jgi:hypothetical protein|nr:MAG: hypothetical protein DIU62_06805 [Pseudomonadota bacterium]